MGPLVSTFGNNSGEPQKPQTLRFSTKGSSVSHLLSYIEVHLIKNYYWTLYSKSPEITRSLVWTVMGWPKIWSYTPRRSSIRELPGLIRNHTKWPEIKLFTKSKNPRGSRKPGTSRNGKTKEDLNKTKNTWEHPGKTYKNIYELLQLCTSRSSPLNSFPDPFVVFSELQSLSGGYLI